jgi:hypothetical protein
MLKIFLQEHGILAFQKNTIFFVFVSILFPQFANVITGFDIGINFLKIFRKNACGLLVKDWVDLKEALSIFLVTGKIVTEEMLILADHGKVVKLKNNG